MGLLDRYVLRVFALHWLVVGAALLGLLSVFDLLAHGDELAQTAEGGGFATGLVLRYYLENLPFQLVQFAPYVTLLAGVGTVLKLSRGREWTPVLGAGRPTLRSFLPLFCGAAVAAALQWLAREEALPALAPSREALERHLFHQRPFVLRDLWSRGRDDVRLHADWFDPACGVGSLPGARPTLWGLEVHATAPDGSHRRLHASSATWDGVGWALEDGWSVTEGRGEEPATRFEHRDLGPEGLLLAYFGQANPFQLSAGQYAELRLRDPDHRQAATFWWAAAAAPLSHILLLLLALPFVLRFDRPSTLEGAAIGALLSLLFFTAHILLQDLGVRGVVPPFWAGAGAALLFGTFGVAALERLPT